MKPPQVLIACLSVALVAMILAHVSSTSIDGLSNARDQGAAKNPCKEAKENKTVSTPEGIVLCIVPGDEELTEQLKSVGGYNKHYVAVTHQEAEHFEPILPGWDGAATTKPTKPTPTRRCRRYRRGYPNFPRRRYWKRSVDLTKPEWHDEQDDPEAEQGSKMQKKTEKSQTDTFRRMFSRDGGNELVRSKRFDQEGIRESVKVGCVKIGERIGNLKQMCDKCQRRTELTTDRFPRYISEVTCESQTGSPTDGTSSCQYQIGKCAQGYLLIDLLKRTDQYTEVSPPSSGIYFKAFKQIWVPYTHKIRSCCECQSSG